MTPTGKSQRQEFQHKPTSQALSSISSSLLRDQSTRAVQQLIRGFESRSHSFLFGVLRSWLTSAFADVPPPTCILATSCADAPTIAGQVLVSRSAIMYRISSILVPFHPAGVRDTLFTGLKFKSSPACTQLITPPLWPSPDRLQQRSGSQVTGSLSAVSPAPFRGELMHTLASALHPRKLLSLCF